MGREEICIATLYTFWIDAEVPKCQTTVQANDISIYVYILGCRKNNSYFYFPSLI